MKKIKVKILRGCPASGKTKLRKEWLCKKHYGVISRDELRHALFGWYGPLHTKGQEDIITMVSDILLQQYLRKGMDVIIDNTNLRAKDVRPFLQTIAFYNENGNIEIEFVDLTGTPLKTLKLQNKNRDATVPESEIDRLFKTASHNNTFYEDVYKKPQMLENDVTKPKAVVFDLDGTLALKAESRGWYDTEGFINDKVNSYVYGNYLMHKDNGHKVIICTARGESCKMETWEWLTKHNIKPDEIFFRKDGDFRKDSTIKREMWEKILKQYYIFCLYDDRLDVVKRARGLGLDVFSTNHMYY